MKTLLLNFEFLKLVGFRESLDVVLVFLIPYLLYSDHVHTELLCICICILLASSFFTHTINDIYDYKTDYLNKRDKPLVKGFLTLKQAKIIAVYFFCCTIFFSLLTKDVVYTNLSILLLILGLAYSHPLANFSHNSILSILVIILGSVIIPYSLGLYAALGHYEFSDNIFLLIGIVLIVIGRVILKDIWDFKGDKLTGRKTFAVLIKTNKLLIFSLFMHLVGTVCIFNFVYRYVSMDVLFICATLSYVFVIIFILLQQNKIKEANQANTIRRSLIKIYFATRLYFIAILIFIFLN